MSERSWAKLTIGGQAPIQALSDILEVHPSRLKELIKSGNTAEIVYREPQFEDGFLIFESPEAPGGMFSELEERLVEQGISFDRKNSGYPGLWSDGVLYFRPGIGKGKRRYETISDAEQSGPYVEVELVREKLAEGPEALKAWLEAEHPKVPPLEPITLTKSAK